jgi:hypothetical protein
MEIVPLMDKIMAEWVATKMRDVSAEVIAQIKVNTLQKNHQGNQKKRGKETRVRTESVLA